MRVWLSSPALPYRISIYGEGEGEAGHLGRFFVLFRIGRIVATCDLDVGYLWCTSRAALVARLGGLGAIQFGLLIILVYEYVLSTGSDIVSLVSWAGSVDELQQRELR